jgi:hypothetical protein
MTRIASAATTAADPVWRYFIAMHNKFVVN